MPGDKPALLTHEYNDGIFAGSAGSLVSADPGICHDSGNAGLLYVQNAKGSASSAISQHTVQLISLLLLPIAVLMMVYALYIYYMRSRFLEKKQVFSLSHSDLCFACSLLDL